MVLQLNVSVEKYQSVVNWRDWCKHVKIDHHCLLSLHSVDLLTLSKLLCTTMMRVCQICVTNTVIVIELNNILLFLSAMCLSSLSLVCVNVSVCLSVYVGD